MIWNPRITASIACTNFGFVVLLVHASRGVVLPIGKTLLRELALALPIEKRPRIGSRTGSADFSGFNWQYWQRNNTRTYEGISRGIYIYI